MRTHLFLMGIVLAVVSTGTQAFADDQINKSLSEPWPGTVRNANPPTFNIPGFHVADWAFEAIDDISILNFDFGDVGVNLDLRRRVFQNDNEFNSFSVVDRFISHTRIPFFTDNSGPLDLWIGTDIGADILNVRQRKYSQLANLPSTAKAKADMTQSQWYKDFSTQSKSSSEQWKFSYDNQGMKKLRFFPDTPENHARFDDFLNSARLPVRLPLSVESFKKLEIGEIVSYTIEPSLEVGAGLSWDVDLSGLTGNLGVSTTAYAKVGFRISVLREEENIVRVKRTLLHTLGDRTREGDSQDWSALDGVFILDQFKHELKIIPFQIRQSVETQWGADRTYRYDLGSPCGRSAYLQAVRGDFAPSDDLAKSCASADWNSKNPLGIEKLSTRTTKTFRQSDSNKVKLAFFYTDKSNSDRSNIEAHIILPDGTRNVFSSVINDSRDWKTLWGTYEKRSYAFSINVDTDRYEQEPQAINAFTMSAEGHLTDSDATAKEIAAYSAEAEMAINRPGLFPRPKKDGLDDYDDNPFNNYGKTRFYYQIDINQPQLEKFLNTPDRDMWPALEEVFRAPHGAWTNPAMRTAGGIFSGGLVVLTSPMYLFNHPVREADMLFHAQKIHDRWIRARGLTNIKEKVEEVGRMFYKPRFSVEMIMLLRKILRGEAIDYTVLGESKAFGMIEDHGTSNTQFGNPAADLNNQIDFEKRSRWKIH